MSSAEMEAGEPCLRDALRVIDRQVNDYGYA